MPSRSRAQLANRREVVGGAPDESGMVEGIRRLLVGCGLNPEDKDLVGTPERVARVWRAEFLAGYSMDPSVILSDTVEGEADPDAVLISGLSFHSMCPHHLFPYRGRAHVLYIPERKLVGFGRISELVDCFTKRLTLQERSTHQIAQALMDHLGALGAGCVLDAEQLCLVVPNEKHAGSRVVTSAFVGAVQTRDDLRARLMSAAGMPA